MSTPYSRTTLRHMTTEDIAALTPHGKNPVPAQLKSHLKHDPLWSDKVDDNKTDENGDVDGNV
jgi:hypothetical protein